MTIYPQSLKFLNHNKRKSLIDAAHNAPILAAQISKPRYVQQQDHRTTTTTTRRPPGDHHETTRRPPGYHLDTTVQMISPCTGRIEEHCQNACPIYYWELAYSKLRGMTTMPPSTHAQACFRITVLLGIQPFRDQAEANELGFTLDLGFRPTEPEGCLVNDRA